MEKDTLFAQGKMAGKGLQDKPEQAA